MAESKTDRTAAGLRDTLFDELDKLRSGRSDPSQAKAIAAVAQTIIKSVEVQLAFEQLKLQSEVPANLSDMRLVPAGVIYFTNPGGRAKNALF